jgi:hypothetical protein
MRITLMAVYVLAVCRLVANSLTVHRPSDVISVELPFQGEFVGEEQELTSVLIIEEFTIQGMHGVHHEAPEGTGILLSVHGA